MELVILYDAHCSVCVRCREVVEASTAIVPVRFVDCRSAEARARYGDIPFLVHELVVVDDEGRWWAGPAAFVMTLWAMERTRGLAETLASPELSWLSFAVFAFVTSHRELLGGLFGVPACEDGACSVAHERPTTAYR